jgi:hypothetical protein
MKILSKSRINKNTRRKKTKNKLLPKRLGENVPLTKEQRKEIIAGHKKTSGNKAWKQRQTIKKLQRKINDA